MVLKGLFTQVLFLFENRAIYYIFVQPQYSVIQFNQYTNANLIMHQKLFCSQQLPQLLLTRWNHHINHLLVNICNILAQAT